MKITKSTLKQLIMEELNNISEAEDEPTLDDIPLSDIALALATDAATAVVNSETVKNELVNFSREEYNDLFNQIRHEVQDIVLKHMYQNFDLPWPDSFFNDNK